MIPALLTLHHWSHASKPQWLLQLCCQSHFLYCYRIWRWPMWDEDVCWASVAVVWGHVSASFQVMFQPASSLLPRQALRRWHASFHHNIPKFCCDKIQLSPMLAGSGMMAKWIKTASWTQAPPDGSNCKTSHNLINTWNWDGSRCYPKWLRKRVLLTRKLGAIQQLLWNLEANWKWSSRLLNNCKNIFSPN